jgi:hypothetical protein
MKIINFFSTPTLQIISFGLLLIGNDKVMAPLFLWLILNYSFYNNIFNYSTYGLICLLLPLMIIIFDLKSKNIIQFISTILMSYFVFMGIPKYYLVNYVLKGNLSNIDLVVTCTSFFFFIIVNISVIIVFFRYYINKKRKFIT